MSELITGIVIGGIIGLVFAFSRQKNSTSINVNEYHFLLLGMLLGWSLGIFVFIMNLFN